MSKKVNKKVIAIGISIGIVIAGLTGVLFYNKVASYNFLKSKKLTLDSLETIEDVKLFIENSDVYDELDDILDETGNVATVLTKYKDLVLEEGQSLPDDFTIPINGVRSDINGYSFDPTAPNNYTYISKDGVKQNLPQDPKDDKEYKYSWDSEMELLCYLTLKPTEVIPSHVEYIQISSIDAEQKFNFLMKYLDRLESRLDGKYYYVADLLDESEYPDNYAPHSSYSLISVIWQPR